jgi:hypothetical protein
LFLSTVDGVWYGDTREAGPLSFTRIFEAGHAMPYYQPKAALQLFNRTINSWDIATGTVEIDVDAGDYATEGEERSTYWNGPSDYKPPFEIPIPPAI